MPPIERVLVIDDDENIVDLLGMVLSDEGYQVDSAPHGAAALGVIDRSPPSIILLNMHMPIMDGSEFAHAYRAKPGPHAPIIVVSAARDAASRARQIAAAEYLPKPFDLEKLLTLIVKHTRHPS